MGRPDGIKTLIYNKNYSVSPSYTTWRSRHKRPAKPKPKPKEHLVAIFCNQNQQGLARRPHKHKPKTGGMSTKLGKARKSSLNSTKRLRINPKRPGKKDSPIKPE